MLTNAIILAIVATFTAVGLWARRRYRRELARVSYNQAHTQALLHDGFLGHLLRNAPLYLGTVFAFLVGFSLGWQAFTKFTAA